MFNDVDESLRDLLVADVPVDRAEVDITFERPTREWSSRISKPTLNLFLFDIRERTDFRDDTWRTRPAPNGTGEVIRERGPRRVDLAYSVTAWTKEPADEHRILARVLATLYRTPALGEAFLRGDLQNVTRPVLLRPMSPDYLAKPSDFWGVMDNELHAAFTWVVTVPMEVFAPQTGPLVTTRILQFVAPGGGDSERYVQVAGVAYRKGEPDGGLAGVAVDVLGTGHRAETDADGRFSFAPLPEGDYTWRVTAPGGKAVQRKVTVPARSYDLELDV